MNATHTRRPASGGTFCAGLALVALAACGAPDSGTTSDNGAADAVTTTPLEWEARSTSGSLVTVRPRSLPVRAGPAAFEIEVDSAVELSTLTLDLFSPDMPAHGILRFTATPLPGRGRFEAEPSVPMEGRWALYVNLDEGGDAAEFRFDAQPAEGSVGHVHGSGATAHATPDGGDAGATGGGGDHRHH